MLVVFASLLEIKGYSLNRELKEWCEDMRKDWESEILEELRDAKALLKAEEMRVKELTELVEAVRSAIAMLEQNKITELTLKKIDSYFKGGV